MKICISLPCGGSITLTTHSWYKVSQYEGHRKYGSPLCEGEYKLIQAADC